TGKLIVFPHGLFGRGKNFASIAKALSPEFSSLLVDLPDHGESAWTDAFSYVATADAVAAAITEATDPEDRPVHLVGHSLGGKVAMVLALRHPDLVDRLVVVDIAPSGGGDVGTFDHLLTSLAELDLDTVSSRTEADAALQETIPDPTVRGFLLQNLRPDSGGYAWQP
ncbi:alpha/beta fold hydrolase, partial [Catellatospora coxensis]|uniref:alpha/beta fold hydrolase n=1 Tax=Catellatospora coxensis TaxID=310354 RepID=UPI0031DD7018